MDSTHTEDPKPAPATGARRPHVASLIVAGVMLAGTLTLAMQSNSPAPIEPEPVRVAETGATPETVEPTPMEQAATQLTQDQRSWLDGFNWEAWVGSGKGIWVSVDEQRLRLIENRATVWETACATAANGTGSQIHSNKTPLGWHSIAEKIGDGAPWGQVFRSRGATNEIWTPGQDTKSDLVLTRILWLTGEEPNKNKGGTVDSYRRFIYIHGTNGEDRIGTPSSHGCVRLRNDDVITLFDLVEVGTYVLITERSS